MLQQNRFVSIQISRFIRLILFLLFTGDIKDNNLHFQWKNVSVRDYDAERQLWLVSTDERQHDVFDMYRPAKRARRQPEAIEGRRGSIDYSSGSLFSFSSFFNLVRLISCLGSIHSNQHHTDSLYWIPRIQLHFLAEDPRTFADRVTKAYHDRKRTEAELRTALFIDCMPTDGIGKLDDERIKRMIELAKTSAIFKTM